MYLIYIKCLQTILNIIFIAYTYVIAKTHNSTFSLPARKNTQNKSPMKRFSQSCMYLNIFDLICITFSDVLNLYYVL